MEPVRGVYAIRMMTYTKALKMIMDYSSPLKIRTVPIKECLGKVLAQDVFSPEPFPAFNNSAVDGYAISFNRVRSHWLLSGEIAAGQCFRGVLKPGYAMRIFTGAPIPKGVQAVIMQEDALEMNGSVTFLRLPKQGANIRFRGEDFKKGRLLIRKGTLLEASHLALLVAVGCKGVSVYPAPKVAILATGSELLKKGGRLKTGQIRDCNTVLLEALVRQSGSIPFLLPHVGDDPQAIRHEVQRGLAYDFFLLTGGVSVGKYDWVREVLKCEGVEEIFWKVDIKPGKPLFFGRKGRTLIFGLPGNPVSAFVCYEEFVKPALLKCQGKKSVERKMYWGYLTREFRNGSRLHFVRVRCEGKRERFRVTPCPVQGSHMIGELATANALLQVKPNAVLKKNQKVLVKMIGEAF